MKKNNNYTVYTITIPGESEPCYVGITKDLKRRQKQHRYLYRKGTSKELYSYFSSISLDEENIVLEVLKTNLTERMAECLEAYIILSYYFSGKPLKQNLPRRIRYY